MTVITKISTKNTFILMGDSLISGHEREEEIFIPTIESVYEAFPPGSGWSISNLKNKVHILGKNIVIGWYGNFTAAKVIIKELRDRNNNSPMSLDNINEFLSNSNITKLVGDYINSDIVGFTGFVLENQKVESFDCHTGNPQILKCNLPHGIGDIKFYGSGQKDFKDYITSNFDRLTRDYLQSPNSDSIHKLFLDISSYFLAKEIVERTNIYEAYGGYYNFVGFINDQPLKRKEHTYFFWTVIPDEYGNPKADLQLESLKSIYRGDQIVESLKCISKEPNKVDASIHLISPIYMDIAELKNILPTQNPGNFNLNSEYSCHFVLVGDPKDSNHQTWLAAFSIIKTNLDTVTIKNCGLGLKFKINPYFVKCIENQTQKIWNQYLEE